MIINHHREKLIDAIVYFASHARHLGRIKLSKLLYLLDFEHFQTTGRNVTGLSYYAWRWGPAPVELLQELEDPSLDLAAAIVITPDRITGAGRETIRACTDFEGRHFSKREMRILSVLIDRYRATYSPGVIDVIHGANGAWYKTWDEGRGFNRVIDYALAVPGDDPHRQAILDAAREYREVAAKGTPDSLLASDLV